MSTPPVLSTPSVPSLPLALPYFHADALRQQFARDLANASVAGGIDEQEHQWLSMLINPPSQVVGSDPLRVDRIVMDDGASSGTEMTAAMLISHQTNNDPRVYLSTVLHGLESFKDRQHLLSTLKDRFEFLLTDDQQLDAELMEGEVFEKRMLAIMDQQQGQISQLAEQLEQLPSLRDAVNQTLRQHLERLLPGQPIDPASVLLQVVQATSTSPSGFEVFGVGPLSGVGLDTFCGQTLQEGQAYRFLDSQGGALDATQCQPYLDALAGMIAALPGCFEQLLDGYWRETNPQGTSRRDIARQGLSAFFRQQLLDCRQRGELDTGEFQAMRALLPSKDEALSMQVRSRIKSLFVRAEGGASLQIAGMFLFDAPTYHSSELWVFSASIGLRRFDSLMALHEYFLTTQGRVELARHVSPQARPAIVQEDLPGMAVMALDLPLFDYLVESVIALQKRNLAFAWAQPYSDREQAPVAIDDALDIRHLIDRRLVLLTGSSRWLDGSLTMPASAQGSPSGRNATPQLVASVLEAPGPALTLMPSWLELFHHLDMDVQRVSLSYPGIQACARDLLNQYLAVFADERLDAGNIHLVFANVAVQQGGAWPSSMRLCDLLLERVTGHRLDDVPLDSQVIVGPPDDSLSLVGSAQIDTDRIEATLTPSLVNQLLKRVHAQFSARYLQGVGDFYTRPFRQGNAQLDASVLFRDIFQALLRAQIGIEDRVAHLDPLMNLMLEQVLDRPVPWMRDVLKNDRVEVFTLHLQHQPARPTVQMSNAFVLQRPLHADSRLLFWCPLKGLRVFDSRDELDLYLNAHFNDANQREQWLGLLNKGDDELVRQWLLRSITHRITVQTQRINHNFLDVLQSLEQQRKRSCIEDALEFATRCRLDARLFDNLMGFTESDNQFGPVLDGLTIAVQGLLIDAFIPDWLKKAPLKELAQYTEILIRYHLTNDPSQDFLVGIPRLRDYARDRLMSQLDKDFPGQALDPDTVQLTLTRYLPAPVSLGQTPSMIPAVTQVAQASLTEYAITHFSTLQAARLTIETSDDTLAAAQLTPSYVKQLVHALDVSAGYQQLLAQKLDEKDPDYANRRKSFMRQTPASMLELAFEYRLEMQLSTRAFEFIQNLVEMPDSVARQPVYGQEITLWPLQLLAAPDLEADTVSGLYVMGPKDPSQGPVILHALFHSEFSFKEYANQAALLEDIRTSSSLQDFILQRVADDARKRYDHGGFMEPHLPWSTESLSDVPLSRPGPVSLSVQPVQSNLLQYLFIETLAALQAIARKQTVTSAEADWQSFLYLMTLGFEQVLTFLPGKLGTLVAAWQSHSWFKASATAAYHRRWGMALSEFTAALGVLISSAPESEPELEAEELATAGVGEPDIEPGLPKRQFSWADTELTPELTVRLQTFEVTDVALKDLFRDALYNLYQSQDGHERYAVVGGKVYRVCQDETMHWRIVSSPRFGPRIRLNELQQWELDLRVGLLGGGGLVSRSQTDRSDLEAEQAMLIEATGMPEIRRLFRDRARRIGQAHLQAKGYLDVSLDNLNAKAPQTSLDARTLGVIQDFFAVPTAGSELIGQIKSAITGVFNAILDASLSPFSSPRYVVGVNQPGQEATIAFTIHNDPLQRIFLTERFFNIPPYQLKPRKLGLPSFNMDMHYRSATLIHEVSHLANNTFDIAYLESSAPYLDLLADDTPYDGRFIEDLTIMHNRLSHLTPRNQLFKVFEHGRWRDLDQTDGGGKALILEVTGTATLEQARDVFFNDAAKRSTIILNNADSLTLLVLLLGRERFVQP